MLIGSLVGVNESPIRVRNEGMNLAATILILERCAEAARLLGHESELIRRCREAAAGLRKMVDLLFNGQYFVAAEGTQDTTTASTGVIYPLNVIPFQDRRAVLTGQALLQEDQRNHHNGREYNFPWHWGVLGTILACQQDSEAAWKAIQMSRTTICSFGGMTEVMEDGEWNMQYFLTAQAAVVTALHSLLLQGQDEVVELFPAVPNEWETCSFERMLSIGLEVSGTYHHGRIQGEVRNIAPVPLERTLKAGKYMEKVLLKPGETRAIQTP